MRATDGCIIRFGFGGHHGQARAELDQCRVEILGGQRFSAHTALQQCVHDAFGRGCGRCADRRTVGQSAHRIGQVETYHQVRSALPRGGAVGEQGGIQRRVAGAAAHTQAARHHIDTGQSNAARLIEQTGQRVEGQSVGRQCSRRPRQQCR